MNVAVVGLWHLGVVTAACLATAGFRVVAVDGNAETITSLQADRLPVFEPGVLDLVRAGKTAGLLSFTTATIDVSSADVVWITYDTPVDDDDRADVAFVMERVISLFPYLKENALVLISSQLPVGSTRDLEQHYAISQPQGTATFAYSPENLRLGKAIDAFTKPERVVVGVRAANDRQRIATLFHPFTERVEWMSVESAEMTKHTLNAFLATSVAFANEIAVLCEQVGADAYEVERGLKSDGRIGPRAYLRPGGAFAGGTLARDIEFLLSRGREMHLPMPLLTGVQESNSHHRQWAQRWLQNTYGTLATKSIAVLGLTYKPGTSTLRRSSAVELCRWAAAQGATVKAYDPAVKELPDQLVPYIQLCPSIDDVLKGTHAVVIGTEWPEFIRIQADEIVKSMSQPIVLDASSFLAKQLGTDKRVIYVSVGRSV